MSGSRAATGGDGGKHSKNCATEWTGGARVLSETESEHIPGAARRSLGIRKIAEVGRRAQEPPDQRRAASPWPWVLAQAAQGRGFFARRGTTLAFFALTGTRDSPGRRS